MATVGAPGAPDTEIVALRSSGGLGLTAEAHTRSEGPTGKEKKNSESRVRRVFQRDDAPGIGAVQMPWVGWLAGLGRFNFRLAHKQLGTEQRMANPRAGDYPST